MGLPLFIEEELEAAGLLGSEDSTGATGVEIATEPAHTAVAALGRTKEPELSADHLPDYSTLVKDLAANEDLVWHSSEPRKFKKNAKINILRIIKDGYVRLDIIKQGNNKQLSVKINPADVAQVRETLADMIIGAVDWEKDTTLERWRTPDGQMIEGEAGSVDGNTYVGHRKLKLGNDQVLVWKVAHRNNGITVDIGDELSLESE